MKSTQKKETTQVFEFETPEVIECFSSYLKGKNIIIPEKSKFSFEIKVNSTSRELENVKMTTKLLEEGPASTNGANGKEIVQ